VGVEGSNPFCSTIQSFNFSDLSENRSTGRVLALDRSLEDTLPYLFSLLGIVDPPAQMDGQIKRRRTLEAIKRIVLRESLNQEEELLLPQAPKSREEEQPY
jgi:hypothetical protein